MPADIRYSVVRDSTTFGPFTNTSENILRKGDVINLECPNIDQVSYYWVLSYKPVSSGGTASLAALTSATARTTSFTADFDGAYLVQLTVNQGVAGEDTQFIRVRGLTKFSNLSLIAAGERYNQEGPVPIDADPQGWADFLNNNLQKALAVTRRNATTGRQLYVDANRPRGWEGLGLGDITNNPANDPTKYVEYPGTDHTNATTDAATGIRMPTEGVSDFSTIQAAINYAITMNPVPSLTNPVWVLVKPGLYVEDLTLHSHVYVIAETTINETSSLVIGTLARELVDNETLVRLSSVVVQTVTSAGHIWESGHLPQLDEAHVPAILAYYANLPVFLTSGILFENWIESSSGNPQSLFNLSGTGLFVCGSDIYQNGTTVTQESGPALSMVNPQHGTSSIQRDFFLVVLQDCLLAKVEQAGDEEPLILMDSAGVLQFVGVVQTLSGETTQTILIPDEASVDDGGSLGAKAADCIISMVGNISEGATASTFIKGVPGSISVESSNIEGDIVFDSDVSSLNISYNPAIAIGGGNTFGKNIIVNDNIFDPAGDGAYIEIGLVEIHSYASSENYRHPVILTQAPTKVLSSVVPSYGPSYGIRYDTTYIHPDRGTAGDPVLETGQQWGAHIPTMHPSIQNVADLMLQLALPEAPPSSGPDIYHNRSYTPTLGSLYKGVWKLETDYTQPTAGEGFGRVINIQRREFGDLDGYYLPVQIQPPAGIYPTEGIVTDRRLLRFGTGNEDVSGLYVDVGCEVDGTLKIYGDIEADNIASSSRSTIFQQIDYSGGWIGDDPGGPVSDFPGGGWYDPGVDTIIYGIFWTGSEPAPSIYLPQSRGLIGDATQRPVEGQIVIVKDISGSAGAQNIIVRTTCDTSVPGSATGAQIPEGDAPLFVTDTLTTNFESVTYVYHVNPLYSIGFWYKIS